MTRPAPARGGIVLLGGGHAHVHVLTAFARWSEPEMRPTLITRDLSTPYSGMLPGVVAGLYTAEQAHIDLARLTTATGAHLIHAEVIGIDRINKRVELSGQSPIPYDILSVDVGITPALTAIAGAAEHGIAVKPIGSFLCKFDGLLEQCRRQDGPRRIAIIGGGAGGVELLLSVQSRLVAEALGAGRLRTDFSFALVTAGEILQGHNAGVKRAFRRVLAEREVALHEHHAVKVVAADGVTLDDGSFIHADTVLVTTDAAPPPWFAGTGLACDAGGFLATRPTLQVLNDPDVFAAGDCASIVESPRPKAGVFAVRAGPPLAVNLHRRVRGETLAPWRPQRHHLAIISTGERYAIASRGPFKVEGAWVWVLKDWIDRRWMRRYQAV